MARIGIIGARGFAGGELLRIGLQHPDFEITYVTSESQAGEPVAAGFPGMAGATALRYSAYDAAEAIEAADAFFFALPDGEAMTRAGELLDAGKKVVDLSGDFRVKDAETYERWYGREHRSRHLLDRAVYGLPELGCPVAGADLVANPGCFPTVTLLALAPLFTEGLARPNEVVVDAKSGVSGAGGRTALDPRFSAAAVHDNFRAYSVTGHRHIAEMEQELARLTGHGNTITFAAHLLPLMRGILATCYVRPHGPVTQTDLVDLYRRYYRSAPFVHVLDEALPELRYVTGSNACHLALRVDDRTGRVICLGVIDNLVKGAAGSAVQNMNLALGLDETSGLRSPAIGP